ncbi:MAG: nitroreductase family protein [Bacteroidaceae bacterium]|nr:nitroreductase family protein [Bacteroidaceae bacterium]
MENFKELIQRRRSMRKFTPELLKDDDVALLMRAALMSPSSHRSCDWNFILVDDKAKLQVISECRQNGAAHAADAPLAIVVLGDPTVTDCWVENASIAALMIQLQAEDLGLGSCWIQIRGRMAPDGTPSGEVLRELLDIPEGPEVLCVVVVGHKGMERKPFNEEHLQWEKVHINKW